MSMNLRRRFLLVSGSHLHLLKRTPASVGPALACVEASVGAPSAAAGSVKADLLVTGSLESYQKEKAKEAQRKKTKIFEELLENLGAKKESVKETLNAFTRREKERGLSINRADLVRWAKQLHKNGKHQQALEILQCMDVKKGCPLHCSKKVDEENCVVRKELEIARNKIKELQRQIQLDAHQTKG